MTRASRACQTIVLLSFVLTGLFQASARGAESVKPELSVKVVHYEITGMTADELREGLDKHVGVNGRLARHDAYTEWNVDWSYPTTRTNGRCAIGPVAVKVTIIHTVPKWKAPASANPELVRKWNAYIDALEVHEAGHRRFGIAAGNEILRALGQLGTYATCDELERVADATADKIVDRLRQKEEEYDKTTGHGATQSCRFP